MTKGKNIGNLNQKSFPMTETIQQFIRWLDLRTLVDVTALSYQLWSSTRHLEHIVQVSIEC